MKKSTRLTRSHRPTQFISRLGLCLVIFVALQMMAAWFAPVAALAAPPTPPRLNAPIAIAVDANTGRILYNRDMNRRVAMASTTKIMTGLTAISIPGVNLQDNYTVVKEDLVGEASMGLRAGETLTFNDLLHGMLIRSGNDAATAIARFAGAKLPGTSDPYQRFVEKMNQQAASYGLQNTRFANPHGLDANGHYSTAYDLAIAGWYLLKNPTLSKIVATQNITVAGHPLNTSNAFLKRYAGANGIKPGETDNAGLCLVASATRNGQTIISVILNDDLTGYNNDPITLTDYAFAVLAQPLSTQGGNPAEYIGRPDGSRLIIVNAPQAAINAVTPNAQVGGGKTVALEPASRLFNAQIVQAQATVQPTTAPDIQPTTSTGGSTSGVSPTQTSSSGGLNWFLILLILAIILIGVWAAARFGYIGGEKGQDLAFRIEDGAVAAGGAIGSRVGKLINSARKEPNTEANTEDREARPSAPQVGQTYRYTPRVRPEANREQPAAPSAPDVSYTYKPASIPRETNSSGTDYTYSDTLPGASRSSRFPAQPPTPRPSSAEPNNMSKKANPLDSFFDDVEPFDFNDEESAQPAASSFDNQPFNELPPAVEKPASLPQPRPNPNHPSRTAAQPQQQPSNSYDLRPPMPISPDPLSRRPVSTGNLDAETPKPASNLGNPPTPPGQESVVARAQAAIDYAYAGRLQASTDEFRKVIEQNPLFDFGGLDAFEHMPVIGYKALANAYRNAGRMKFALLLLDLAIEKFPNELEFRNMLRTFKRESEI